MYQIEIDKVDRTLWDYLMTQFDDASIYQTWSMGKIVKANSLSHIIVKIGGEIHGCCQVRLKRIPYINVGFADIIWGPICMKRGKPLEPNILLNLICGIKEEYGINRGYMVRIWPHAKGERKKILKQIFESEGFKSNPEGRPYRTFIIDLSSTLEDLRKNLLQKWRNCLNKAERNDLKVVEGTDKDLFRIFLILAKEMGERKSFFQGVDYDVYRQVQENLSESLKMKIMICELDGEPVCAAICSAIGDTGIYLLGASGQKGLTVNASYLLQWRMIQWLKKNGFRYYDLGAFNAEINPGVYHFKRGLAGKKECEEIFLGRYDGCFNLRGRMANLILLLRQGWTWMGRHMSIGR